LKGELVAVLGEAIARPHPPGVVDEQIDSPVVGPQLFGGPVNRRQRRQVQLQRAGLRPWRDGADAGRGVCCLAQVPAGQHDGGAVLGEYLGRLKPSPVLAPVITTVRPCWSGTWAEVHRWVVVLGRIVVPPILPSGLDA
jgi:hypothetical protein